MSLEAGRSGGGTGVTYLPLSQHYKGYCLLHLLLPGYTAKATEDM